MAEKTMKREENEGEKGKKKKLHLHQVRTVAAEDGSHVHHHTYKDHKGAPFTHPERENVATSASPEEAGQHVEEAFAQNGGGQGEQESEEAGEQGAEAAPVTARVAAPEAASGA